MEIKIPVYKPLLSGNEKIYVNECLESTWISSKGKFVNLFEQAFAEYVDVKFATGVCNGTVALHLALIALGVGNDDEVIVPTLTYVASVNAITYTGAKPVFVDSLQDTWQMSAEDIIRKITPKTKAIMCVHLYGHPCDMDAILKIVKDYDLFLIEDCAEAIGTKYKGKHVGGFGDIATFSFYGNKTITTGEGGMVVTNDETLYQRSVHYKGQGLAKYREYWHDVVGYNYRMTNICAAIGLAQLEQVGEILDKKRRIAKRYEESFKATKIQFHSESKDALHSYWMCSILVDTPALRDTLRLSLAEKGIETRPVFYPIHTMPIYSGRYERHKVAENLGWRGINLPSFPGLKTEEVDYIIDCILLFMKEN
ncbi:MAG TPA: DegT/DnrJ/EryC1/StrS aminotransferase family protein [Saprospiraceae bacterium]|nr:DegT/DnrJ/EryC1/StrS aminotransferase family protein [Saprospiraceae bacterium]HMQ84673.1 DegT/DnrJ/EryC1/StrS aminotransferase family protein [Saprospiraceae bacterium]